jgi:hypothetical protein
VLRIAARRITLLRNATQRRARTKVLALILWNRLGGADRRDCAAHRLTGNNHDIEWRDDIANTGPEIGVGRGRDLHLANRANGAHDRFLTVHTTYEDGGERIVRRSPSHIAINNGGIAVGGIGTRPMLPSALRWQNDTE